jgi:hypothetical protein
VSRTISFILKLAMFVFAFGFFMQAAPVSYVRHGFLTLKAQAMAGRLRRSASLAWRGALHGAGDRHGLLLTALIPPDGTVIPHRV